MSVEKNVLENRIEIVFLYDVRDANPNGDPDFDNMPRLDNLTGENVVTDVRLKRTIRDYWIANGKEVLIKAVDDKSGNRQTMEERVKTELKISEKEKGLRNKINIEVPKRFLDIRSFGAAITYKGANTSITGPVQFGLGRSMNKPRVITRTITTSLASGTEKGQGTIGEYHTVDYSLIKFHGLISEVSAKELNYTLDDLQQLYNGLWCGTKQLNTRSKFNHSPRLLIAVISKKNKTQIGDLDLYLKLASDSEIKSFKEAQIDITEFVNRIKNNVDLIKTIKIKIDPNTKLLYNNKSVDKIEDALKKEEISIPVKELELIC
ncbi:MAG: type I-B CRISPR-associated protein Cas7/Csh2 [Promethearchaeota archaeon]